MSTVPMQNLIDDYAQKMERGLKVKMRHFVATIPFAERADFFHPMNRDLWQAEFGRYLQQKGEFASND
ncbi:MAG TPA: hypothetical protein VN682_17010 [Terriglobales bacterium]|nr:hypothetical protein [Terriglobales bacterium]